MAEILNVTQLLICWFTHISEEHEYHWQLLKKTKETKIHPNSEKKRNHDIKCQTFVLLSEPVLQAELCQIPSSMGKIPQILLS